MEKKIKEERIKELNSRKKWEKIDNGFWFMIQTFMLSITNYAWAAKTHSRRCLG